MGKSYPPRKFDNRIMFRPSPQTFEALSALGERQGISASTVARRILEESMDLLGDRILVRDELVRIMLSDVEAERLGVAEYFARLRAISLREGDRP